MYPSPPTLHRLLMQPAFLRLGIRSLNIYTSVMGKDGGRQRRGLVVASQAMLKSWRNWEMRFGMCFPVHCRPTPSQMLVSPCMPVLHCIRGIGVSIKYWRKCISESCGCGFVCGCKNEFIWSYDGSIYCRYHRYRFRDDVKCGEQWYWDVRGVIIIIVLVLLVWRWMWVRGRSRKRCNVFSGFWVVNWWMVTFYERNVSFSLFQSCFA